MQAIITGGTWTTFGSIPYTISLFEDSVSSVRGNRIELENEVEDPVLDHRGAELMTDKFGELTISATNKSDRDKILVDLKNVLLATNYSFSFSDVVPSAPQKNRFIYKLRVGVLD